MRHPPQRATTTGIHEWVDGQLRPRLDDVAGEEPLEIRAGHTVVTITMRTPGDDFELAAGFLYSEGIVDGRDDICRISFGLDADGCRTGNAVDVILRNEPAVDITTLERNFVASSSCGVCGRTSIDAVLSRDTPRPNPRFSIDADLLTRLPALFRSAQRVFGRTGGLHAAGLFDASGRLALLREDIGRHNAVDKVIGAALLEGSLPCSDRLLLVSGRGGFEIVQKALVAGVPILASVSAPSNLAVRMARDGGLTLIGFLREQRFVVYSHPERISG